EGRGAPADLRSGAGRTDRQRGGGRAGTKKDEREWERVADPERTQDQEERDGPGDPTDGNENPRLRRAPQRGRAWAQPAAEPRARVAWAALPPQIAVPIRTP